MTLPVGDKDRRGLGVKIWIEIQEIIYDAVARSK